MKFSIIVPVYNVEKYIAKCLESVINQTYKNFEVIVVNDGTKDNSQNIIDEYVKKDDRIKSFIKENGGPSSARNYGIEKVTGDYILFLDSDDYIDSELLNKVNSIFEKDNDIEVLKYKIREVDKNHNTLYEENNLFQEGYIDFKELIKSKYIDTPVNCFYKVDFWKKNRFEFQVGRIHEDFGLIPYVVVVAKKMYYLDFVGYYYFQRSGSITNGGEKSLRSFNDTLFHYKNLYKLVFNNKNINKENREYFLSFIANGVINRLKNLKGKNLKNAICEVKKEKVIDNFLANSLPRRIKKIIAKINLKLYIKIFK